MKSGKIEDTTWIKQLKQQHTFTQKQLHYLFELSE